MQILQLRVFFTSLLWVQRLVRIKIKALFAASKVQSPLTRAHSKLRNLQMNSAEMEEVPI